MTRTIEHLQAALRGSAPTDIAIDDVLATIRRRAPIRRRNRVIASISATALLAAGALAVPALLAGRGELAGPSPAATFTSDCSIEALPLPDLVAEMYEQTAVQAHAIDMDATGRFVLASFAIADGRHNSEPVTVLWDDGVPAVLAMSDPEAFAEAVNAHGVVVGTVLVDTQPEGIASLVPNRPFVYENGSMSLLPLPAGYQGASAHAINDRGEIAGFAMRDAVRGWDAVVWSAGADRTPRVLQSPGGASFATAISSDGTVVGVAAVGGSLTDPDTERPYVWGPDGVGRFLDLPEGYVAGGAHQVRGDWALGGATRLVSSDPLGRSYSVVLWNVRTGDVSIVDVWSGEPNAAVNAHGDVVTYDGVGSSIIRDGRSYPLPHLQHTGTSLGWSTEARAISDDATVILGEHSTDTWEGPTPIVLWHC